MQGNEIEGRKIAAERRLTQHQQLQHSREDARAERSGRARNAPRTDASDGAEQLPQGHASESDHQQPRRRPQRPEFQVSRGGAGEQADAEQIR